MNNLTRISTILSVIKIAGAFLGILRTRLLVQFFGANFITDAFVMAWTIPSTLINLLIGTIYLTIIPELTHSFKKDRMAGMSLFWSIFNSVMFLSVILWLVLILFGPNILQNIYVFKSAEQFLLTKNFLYWLAPLIVFQLLLSSLSGVYATGQIFIFQSVIQLIPLCLGIVGLFFYKKISLYGLLIGILVGNVISFSSSMLFLRNKYSPLYFHFKIYWHWITEKRNTFVLMFGIQLVIQSLFVVDKIMASFLNEGQLSILHYSMRLNEMIFQGFILTLVVTTYPLISKYLIDKDQTMFNKTLIIVLKKILYIAIPIVTIILLDINDGIIFIFKSKNFMLQETLLMSNVLSIYSLGLLFAGFNAVFFRVFIANRMFFPLLLLGLGHLIIKIFFNYLWIDSGILGFSMSSVLSLFIWFLFAIILLKSKQVINLHVRQIKVIVVPILLSIISFFIGKLLLGSIPETQYLIRFLISILTILIIYTGGLFLTARKDITNLLSH